jgi:hypothetical protein
MDYYYKNMPHDKEDAEKDDFQKTLAEWQADPTDVDDCLLLIPKIDGHLEECLIQDYILPSLISDKTQVEFLAVSLTTKKPKWLKKQSDGIVKLLNEFGLSKFDNVSDASIFVTTTLLPAIRNFFTAAVTPCRVKLVLLYFRDILVEKD